MKELREFKLLTLTGKCDFLSDISIVLYAVKAFV